MSEDTVTIRTAHLLRRGKSGHFPKGSTVTVTRREYESNPGMGTLVGGEMDVSPLAAELPVEGEIGGNGPLVEKLVEAATEPWFENATARIVEPTKRPHKRRTEAPKVTKKK